MLADSRSSRPVFDLIVQRQDLEADTAWLVSEHRLFAGLHARNGSPPLWRREASFATLVRFILEQQVSLASANAAFGRLEARTGRVAPEGLLASTDDEMRADGFSRQKSGYVRGIADQMVSGELAAADLVGEAHVVEERLLEIRGIGPWTASCYLLFVLGNRDTWPTGDRALHVSMARNMDLSDVPNAETADDIAAPWSPARAAAARMLWHDYLGGREFVPMPNAGFIEGTGTVPL